MYAGLNSAAMNTTVVKQFETLPLLQFIQIQFTSKILSDLF